MIRIEVLGMGCVKCRQLAGNVQAAVRESGLEEAEISKVEDIDKIAGYGVMLTPALVVNGKVVSAGKVSTKEEIKKFIDRYK